MSEQQVPTPHESQYRLTFRVRPPEGCPVRETEGTVSDIAVFFDGNERHCELLVRDGDGSMRSKQYTESATNKCVCTVMIDHGVVPHLEPATSSREIEVSIYIDELTAAQSISEDLDSLADEVELVDYTELGSETGVTSRVDLGSMTEKRRAALKRAITQGYYETPSQTTVKEMAEAAGVSSSAFATRLRKAERELFEQIHRSL